MGTNMLDSNVWLVTEIEMPVSLHVSSIEVDFLMMVVVWLTAGVLVMLMVLSSCSNLVTVDVSLSMVVETTAVISSPFVSFHLY